MDELVKARASRLGEPQGPTDSGKEKEHPTRFSPYAPPAAEKVCTIPIGGPVRPNSAKRPRLCSPKNILQLVGEVAFFFAFQFQLSIPPSKHGSSFQSLFKIAAEKKKERKEKKEKEKKKETKCRDDLWSYEVFYKWVRELIVTSRRTSQAEKSETGSWSLGRLNVTALFRRFGVWGPWPVCDTVENPVCSVLDIV